MVRRTATLLAAVGILSTCKDASGPAVATLVLVRGPAALFLGQTAQFVAIPIDAHGDTISSSVQWSSSDTTTVTVSTTGVATARAVGSAIVSATADGKVGTVSLQVRSIPVMRVDVTPRIDSLYVGDSLQLTAVPRDSVGGALDRPVVWVSSDTTKATVSPDGSVRTRNVGSFAITATSEGRTGGAFLNAQFRVTALLMPDSLSIGLHHVVRLIPSLQSVTGTRLSGRATQWSSSNPTVLSVQQDGTLQPQQFGTTTVVATSEGLADTSLVTVVPEQVTGISVASIASGSVADTTLDAFAATLLDFRGLPAIGNAVTWSVADTTIIRIAPSPVDPWHALLTGLRPGTTQIRVASGSVHSAFDYTLTYPVARFIAQPDSMMLIVGETRPLGGAGVDRFGTRVGIDHYTQTVTSADSTVAAVTSNTPAYIRGQRPGRTSIVFVLSNGCADTVPVVVLATGTPRLSWGADFIAPSPYQVLRVELRSRDSSDGPSAVPRNVELRSTDTSVAVPLPASIVGMVGAESITVNVRRGGFATITASGDSEFASLFVTVYDDPPRVVHISPRQAVMHLGDSLRFTAIVSGGLGPRPYPVSWRSSDVSRATVSDSGMVVAKGAGAVSIIGASGNVSDSVGVIVLSSSPPAISAASPVPLVPGNTVTLDGSGFDPDPAADSVLIDSIPATVTAATDSTLTILVPPTQAWPCSASHMARVVISANGRLGLDSVPLSVAAQHDSLATGEAIVLGGQAAACTELAPPASGAVYVVSIANTGVVTPISFTFSGDARARGLPAPTTLAGPAFFSLDSLERVTALHRHILDRSRELSITAGAPAPLLRAARIPGPQRSVTATINGVAHVRIPRLEDPDFCSSYRAIDARVVYVGAHVVMLEDVAAPLAGTMDTQYANLAYEFDNVMYPKLLANFGNPLALDSLLDNNGRIAMLFSPVVNSYGVGGFVVSCDFYPESVAPSSNTGEIFYAQVPTTPGNGFAGYTVDVWHWLTRSVMMHESKHLTAFAERLSRGIPIEETWLEEASAVLAEEIWSRDIYHTTWKGEANYHSTLYCDVRPTFQECSGRPYAMFNAFAFLYDYLVHAPQRTPLGPTSPDDATFYGSGWSLLRWAIDGYATSESDFLTHLVQEPTLRGADNLAARTNRPFAELLSDWSDALYFETSGEQPSRASWSIPSWKIVDILRGMNNDFPSDFPFTNPLHGATWSLGNHFAFPNELPPGAWALFVGSGSSSAKQLLMLRSPDGALPATLRLQLVRLH